MPATTPVTLKFFSAVASRKLNVTRAPVKANSPAARTNGELTMRYESANAAEQPCQREGAEACGALMVAFLARLPAAFEADEQTDGQRDGEAAKQLFLIHLFAFSIAGPARGQLCDQQPHSTSKSFGFQSGFGYCGLIASSVSRTMKATAALRAHLRSAGIHAKAPIPSSIC